MDPIQFDNLKGILYSESFFSSNDLIGHLEVTWRLHAYVLTFTFGKNFQFVHSMLQLNLEWSLTSIQKINHHSQCTYDVLYLK